MRVSVYIAVSLDGFIARRDGSIDWLVDYPVPAGEDFGYASFFDSVDALVIGSGTFAMVRTFAEWPYGKRKVVVMSHRPVALGGLAHRRIEIVSREPAEVISRLSDEGFKKVYVDGGRIIQSFLRADLIDEMTITRVPVLLGTGLPLFGELSGDVRVEHKGTTIFENGFVQSIYAIPRSSLSETSD